MLETARPVYEALRTLFATNSRMRRDIWHENAVETFHHGSACGSWAALACTLSTIHGQISYRELRQLGRGTAKALAWKPDYSQFAVGGEGGNLDLQHSTHSRQ